MTPTSSSSSAYGVQGIIDIDQYHAQQEQQKRNINGRVDIMEDAKLQFQMFEATTRENKATNYTDALTGWRENSTLSACFFSASNMQIIQNALRAGVYLMSNKQLVVAQQSETHLKVIMRTIYLQNARHLKDNITQQIELLNKDVLDFCIPFVYKEAIFYMKYLEDQSTLVVPLEHSQPVNRDFKKVPPSK